MYYLLYCIVTVSKFVLFLKHELHFSSKIAFLLDIVNENFGKLVYNSIYFLILTTLTLNEHLID